MTELHDMTPEELKASYLEDLKAILQTTPQPITNGYEYGGAIMDFLYLNEADADYSNHPVYIKLKQNLAAYESEHPQFSR